MSAEVNKDKMSFEHYLRLDKDITYNTNVLLKFFERYKEGYFSFEDIEKLLKLKKNDSKNKAFSLVLESLKALYKNKVIKLVKVEDRESKRGSLISYFQHVDGSDKELEWYLKENRRDLYRPLQFINDYIPTSQIVTFKKSAYLSTNCKEYLLSDSLACFEYRKSIPMSLYRAYRLYDLYTRYKDIFGQKDADKLLFKIFSNFWSSWLHDPNKVNEIISYKTLINRFEESMKYFNYDAYQEYQENIELFEKGTTSPYEVLEAPWDKCLWVTLRKFLFQQDIKTSVYPHDFELSRYTGSLNECDIIFNSNNKVSNVTEDKDKLKFLTKLNELPKLLNAEGKQDTESLKELLKKHKEEFYKACVALHRGWWDFSFYLKPDFVNMIKKEFIKEQEENRTVGCLKEPLKNEIEYPEYIQNFLNKELDKWDSPERYKQLIDFLMSDLNKPFSRGNVLCRGSLEECYGAFCKLRCHNLLKCVGGELYNKYYYRKTYQLQHSPLPEIENINNNGSYVSIEEFIRKKDLYSYDFNSLIKYTKTEHDGFFQKEESEDIVRAYKKEKFEKLFEQNKYYLRYTNNKHEQFNLEGKNFINSNKLLKELKVNYSDVLVVMTKPERRKELLDSIKCGHITPQLKTLVEFLKKSEFLNKNAKTNLCGIIKFLKEHFAFGLSELNTGTSKDSRRGMAKFLIDIGYIKESGYDESETTKCTCLKYKLNDEISSATKYVVEELSEIREISEKDAQKFSEFADKEQEILTRIQNYIIEELSKNLDTYYSNSDIKKLIHNKPKCKSIKESIIDKCLQNLYNKGILKISSEKYTHRNLFQLKESNLAGFIRNLENSEKEGYVSIGNFLKEKEENDILFEYFRKCGYQGDVTFKYNFPPHCTGTLQGYSLKSWDDSDYYDNVFYKLSDLEKIYKEKKEEIKIKEGQTHWRFTKQYEELVKDSTETPTNYESLIAQTEEHYTKQINELKEQLKESQEHQQKQFDEIKELVEKNSGYIVPIQPSTYREPTLKEKIKKFFSKFKSKANMKNIPDEIDL